MLLETLLLSPCFLLGRTTHKDSRTTLSVEKTQLLDHEVLLFFDIDDQTNHVCHLSDSNNHRSKLRKLFWGNQVGHPLCDLLVFYSDGTQRVFCFVELKDNKSDLPKATEQVISTYDAFKGKLAPQFLNTYTPKAFICCARGSLPQEHKSCQDQLNTKFKGNFQEDGNSGDLLKFLRGELNSSVNKGRKKR